MAFISGIHVVSSSSYYTRETFILTYQCLYIRLYARVIGLVLALEVYDVEDVLPEVVVLCDVSLEAVAVLIELYQVIKFK